MSSKLLTKSKFNSSSSGNSGNSSVIALLNSEFTSFFCVLLHETSPATKNTTAITAILFQLFLKKSKTFFFAFFQPTIGIGVSSDFSSSATGTGTGIALSSDFSSSAIGTGTGITLSSDFSSSATGTGTGITLSSDFSSSATGTGTGITLSSDFSFSVTGTGIILSSFFILDNASIILSNCSS